MSTIAELIEHAHEATHENTPLATLSTPFVLGQSKYKKVFVHAENSVGIMVVIREAVYLIPWHRVDSIKIPV